MCYWECYLKYLKLGRLHSYIVAVVADVAYMTGSKVFLILERSLSINVGRVSLHCTECNVTSQNVLSQQSQTQLPDRSISSDALSSSSGRQIFNVYGLNSQITGTTAV